jgi:phosphoribosyl 1,2-cyclic phosphate phosphodiesterase
MKTKINILGSGTSTGVPLLGCSCSVCTSDNPKNKRLRTSFYLQTKKGNHILIDTTPDMRTQLLRANIKTVDHTIITHDHADHVHGIDDLRAFCFGPPPRSIPVYTHSECNEALVTRFPYIFEKDYFNESKPVLGGGVPKLHMNLLKADGSEEEIAGDKFKFYLLPHGHHKSLGIVHGKLAIFIDCNTIPTPIVEELAKERIDLLIIDCVKEGVHKTHLTTRTAFELIKRISPKRAGLIHMGHGLDHNYLEELCRTEFRDHSTDVFVTYDTMHLEC